MSDPYSDLETGVLYNKLGLATRADLEAAERRITRARDAELAAHPPPATYDLEHLRAVHRALFSDLYLWAGECRTVDIAKSHLFCRPAFIEEQSHQLFSELAQDNCLRNLARAEFVSALAHYLGEVNAIHPFGRATAAPRGPVPSVGQRRGPPPSAPAPRFQSGLRPIAPWVVSARILALAGSREPPFGGSLVLPGCLEIAYERQRGGPVSRCADHPW